MAGMFRNYIRHPDGRIEECFDIMRFTAWYSDVANRQIARTAVPYGAGDKKAVIVHTMFLGMDHNWSGDGDPVLFETMVFADDDFSEEFGNFGDRYCTEVAARAGHEVIVGYVQESLVSQQDVDKAVASVLALPGDDELTDGLRVVTDGPQPIPLPKRRKIKDPPRQAPNPVCYACNGEGEYMNSFDLPVMCECTIVRRK